MPGLHFALPVIALPLLQPRSLWLGAHAAPRCRQPQVGTIRHPPAVTRWATCETLAPMVDFDQGLIALFATTQGHACSVCQKIPKLVMARIRIGLPSELLQE